MNKKNNLITIIAIILFISLIIILVKNNQNNNNNQKEGYLVEVTFEEIKEKINDKEDFVIVLSQTTCSHCAEYKPILKQVAKSKNIIIYYIDFDKYEDQADEIIEFFNFDGGTPTTFFFKEGKEISIMNRLRGTTSEQKVIAALEKFEYIETE